jgi:putative DNA primase/helicase
MSTAPNSPTHAEVPPVTPPIDSSSPTINDGRFQLRSDGVYKITPNDQPDGEAKEDYICSRLEVVALSRTEDRSEWGKLLKWHDHDGFEHRWSAPKELLPKNGTDLAEILSKGGVNVFSAKAVREYINWENPSERVLLVPRAGWQRLVGRRVFLIPQIESSEYCLSSTASSSSRIRTTGLNV